MSRIDDQIKILQEKKCKITALEKILSESKKFLNKSESFKNVAEELENLLSNFIEKTINSIENDNAIDLISNQENLTKEELSFIKDLMIRAKSKLPKNAQNVEKKIETVIKDKGNLATQDKISFALQNRHLQGKKAEVITEHGNIEGEVRGLDAPYIIVQTPANQVLHATLDKIIIKGA